MTITTNRFARIWSSRIDRWAEDPIFVECVELASTETISFADAKALSRAQRHAYLRLYNAILERQEEEVRRRSPSPPPQPRPR